MSADDIEPEVEPVDAEIVDDGPDKEILAEAKKYGYREATEFDRDPANFKTPEQFLELTTIKYRREKDARVEREKEVAELREQIGRIGSLTEKQFAAREAEMRADYDRRVNEMRAAKVEAVETADVERYKQIETAEQQLLRSAPQAAPRPVEYAPEVKTFLATVPWGADPEKIEVARKIVDQAGAAGVLSTADQLKLADRKMRDFYPDLYVDKPTTSKVDGGGLAGGVRRGKGVDDLPRDAREAGTDFVKRGIFKSMADYAKSYHEQG